MNKHFNIQIFGLVQGVLFRATAKEQADQLGIRGFARNEPDNTVYIAAEGEENQLNKFIKWCDIGPSAAVVEKVVVTEDKMKNFKNFEVY